MIFAIYAYEDEYCGYDGMNSKVVVELDSYKDAILYAIDESIEVIQSYDEIYSTFEEAAAEEGLEEGTDDWEIYISDAMYEDVEFEIYKVIPYDTIENMAFDFSNDSTTFIREHCVAIDPQEMPRN